MAYFGPFPTTTSAYHRDGSGNEYFGEVARGAKSSDPRWQIFRMTYTGDNWIIQFPVDSVTNRASDLPKFVWDDVESYTYRELGT